MVRDLDLKKPPSIAESIDWARTLLLMGAEDIDRETFDAIDVDHRQAPNRHRVWLPSESGSSWRQRRAPAGS